MDIIIKDRGHGKTTDLVYMSAQTGIPIVCVYTPYVKELAKKLNVQIPDPIYIGDLKKMTDIPSKVYLDDLSIILKMLLHCTVAGFTDTLTDRFPYSS